MTTFIAIVWVAFSAMVLSVEDKKENERIEAIELRQEFILGCIGGDKSTEQCIKESELILNKDK